MRKLNLFVFCFLIIVKIQAQITEEWATHIDGKGDYSDNIKCMASDDSNNVYLGGYTVNIKNNRDFLILKLNASGDTVWVRKFDGQNNGGDEFNDMVIDSSGNVIVTGFKKGNGTGDDMFTAKYNPAGDTIWTRVYNYSANEDDRANSVTVDKEGNIYVTGESDGDSTLITNDDYVTLKYNSSGIQQWVKRFNGVGNGTDRAEKVLVDASGFVYVTGRSANNFDDDYATLKYDSSGVQKWMRLFVGPDGGDDRAVAMVIDDSSNVYVTGRSDNGSNDDYITIKYNSAGTEKWIKRYDGVGGGNDRPADMSIDANANIYVTGQSDITPSTPKNYNYLTVKYARSGAQLWTASYNGTGNGDDIPNSMFIDNSGNIFVTGYSDSNPVAGVANDDYTTVKYNSSGAQQWVKKYNGTANAADAANAVCMDKSGNIIVSGKSESIAKQENAVTVKYDASGNEQWTSSYNGEGDNYDNANDIVTDTAGNTYIAGYSVGLDTDRDMCVIKLNPDGDTLWVRKFNGTSNFTDEATAIKVDNPGNVYVTGFTKNSGTSYDYTTIKLNANGDTIWMRKYNSPANESDKAWDIDIDVFGDVYVTGESDSDPSLASNDDFCTVKYNASGVQQWAQRYNGAGNKTDRAVAVEVSVWGTAYVTGRSSNGTDDDIVTIQYTGAGVQQWAKKYNGGNGDNHVSAMTIDGWENVYVTGESKQPGGLKYDYVTIKYNSAGTQQWASRYNGTGNGSDIPKAIITDAGGNVYVTGQSDTDTSSLVENFNYLTVKYNASGVKQWAKDYNGTANATDVASAIVLDDSSNVYITGQCDNGSVVQKNYDFVTIKYNPSGTQQWYAIYNGPANGSDGANAIAYKKGAVYAAGGSLGTSSQRNLTVLKYLCVPMGVDERDVKPQITVFPVPASQYIYVNSSGIIRNLNVSILNILGEEVIKQQFKQSGDASIDVQNLKPGIYILKINDVYFKKIEILR